MAELNNSNKHRTYNVGRSGKSTKVIPLPAVWLNDNKVSPGQPLDMHRLMVDGFDALVIIKRGKKCSQ